MLMPLSEHTPLPLSPGSAAIPHIVTNFSALLSLLMLLCQVLSCPPIAAYTKKVTGAAYSFRDD